MRAGVGFDLAVLAFAHRLNDPSREADSMVSAMATDLRIEILGDPSDPGVHDLLVELALDQEAAYDHPHHDRDAIEQTTRPVQPEFRGENHVFVARDGGGQAVGVVWCVLFDPGTGLEGEIAELYVRPENRGHGVAKRLCNRAMELFRERGVTFACVWTRDDNPSAMAAYRAAGFLPTEQAVLTWLPLPGR